MSDIDELHKKLDKLDTKVDHVIDKLEATNLILAKNTTSLEIHERRTTASEKRIETLEVDNIQRKSLNAVWFRIGTFVVGLITIVGVVFELIHRRN
jgi:tetrahydromethanopterin S-methyltransferase subunit B